MLYRSLMASAVLLALAAPALAQQGSSPSVDRPPTTGALPPGATSTQREGTDQTSAAAFVHAAMQGSYFEILAGQLAADHAQSQSVKSLAATIVSDHRQALERLRAAATADGVKTLDQPVLTTEQQGQLNHLRNARGESFDRLYTQIMEKDHQKDIREFREFSVNGESANLARAARELLPTLESHYRHAETLAQR